MSKELTIVFVREKLKSSLARDSDLDEFCQNFFPAVYKRFTDGMDRTAKINILFECELLSDINNKLDIVNRSIKSSVVNKPVRLWVLGSLALIFLFLSMMTIILLTRKYWIAPDKQIAVVILPDNEDSKYAGTLVQNHLKHSYRIIQNSQWEAESKKLDIDPGSRDPEDLIRIAAILGAKAIISTSSTFDPKSGEWITSIKVSNAETGQVLGVLKYSLQKLMIGPDVKIGESIKQIIDEKKTTVADPSGPDLGTYADKSDIEKLRQADRKHVPSGIYSNLNYNQNPSREAGPVHEIDDPIPKWRKSERLEFSFFARSYNGFRGRQQCSDSVPLGQYILKIKFLRESNQTIIRNLEMYANCKFWNRTSGKYISTHRFIQANQDGIFEFRLSSYDGFILDQCYIDVAYQKTKLPVEYFVDITSGKASECVDITLPYRDRDDSVLSE